MNRQIAAEQDSLRRMMLELHRCRRYYERPESQHALPARSRTPSATVPKSSARAANSTNAARRSATISELLRRLGLVVDLRVADPARLRRHSGCRRAFAGRRAGSLPQFACALSACRRRAGEHARRRRLGGRRVARRRCAALLGADARHRRQRAQGRALHVDAAAAAARGQNADPVDAAVAGAALPGLHRGRHAAGAGDPAETAAAATARVTHSTMTARLSCSPRTSRAAFASKCGTTTRRALGIPASTADASAIGHRLWRGILANYPRKDSARARPTHETPRVDEFTHPRARSAVRLGRLEPFGAAPRQTDPQLRQRGTSAGTPEADDDELVHPVRIRNEIGKGTLPRLRYGRSYAFRAWAVDLAGNSRPHDMNDDPFAPPAPSAAGAAPIAAPGLAHTSWSAAALRAATVQVLQRRETVDLAPQAGATRRGRAACSTNPIIGPAVAQRLRSPLLDRGVRTRGIAAARREPARAGQRHIGRAVADLAQPFVRDAAKPAASALVTALHPFLRWDPVATPVLVPRQRYTEGESLRVLVVRSGVLQTGTASGDRSNSQRCDTARGTTTTNATSPRRRSAR